MMNPLDIFYLNVTCIQDAGQFVKDKNYILEIEKCMMKWAPEGSFSIWDDSLGSGHRYDTIEEFLEDFEF